MSVPAFDPEVLLATVAKAIFAAADPDDADEDWKALPADARETFMDLARAAVTAFTQAAGDLGVRFLPPGVIPMPKSVDEANAMAAAAREFLGGIKRKGRLVTSVTPPLLGMAPDMKRRH